MCRWYARVPKEAAAPNGKYFQKIIVDGKYSLVRISKYHDFQNYYSYYMFYIFCIYARYIYKIMDQVSFFIQNSLYLISDKVCSESLKKKSSYMMARVVLNSYLTSFYVSAWVCIVTRVLSMTINPRSSLKTLRGQPPRLFTDQQAKARKFKSIVSEQFYTQSIIRNIFWNRNEDLIQDKNSCVKHGDSTWGMIVPFAPQRNCSLKNMNCPPTLSSPF